MLGCDNVSRFAKFQSITAPSPSVSAVLRRTTNMEGSVVTYGLSDSAQKIGEPIGEVWLGPGCAV